MNKKQILASLTITIALLINSFSYPMRRKKRTKNAPYRRIRKQSQSFSRKWACRRNLANHRNLVRNRPNQARNINRKNRTRKVNHPQQALDANKKECDAQKLQKAIALSKKEYDECMQRERQAKEELRLALDISAREAFMRNDKQKRVQEVRRLRAQVEERKKEFERQETIKEIQKIKDTLGIKDQQGDVISSVSTSATSSVISDTDSFFQDEEENQHKCRFINISFASTLPASPAVNNTDSIFNKNIEPLQNIDLDNTISSTSTNSVVSDAETLFKGISTLPNGDNKEDDDKEDQLDFDTSSTSISTSATRSFVSNTNSPFDEEILPIEDNFDKARNLELLKQRLNELKKWLPLLDASERVAKKSNKQERLEDIKRVRKETIQEIQKIKEILEGSEQDILSSNDHMPSSATLPTHSVINNNIDSSISTTVTITTNPVVSDTDSLFQDEFSPVDIPDEQDNKPAEQQVPYEQRYLSEQRFMEWQKAENNEIRELREYVLEKTGIQSKFMLDNKIESAIRALAKQGIPPKIADIASKVKVIYT